jgi:hypothetical protein
VRMRHPSLWTIDQCDAQLRLSAQQTTVVTITLLLLLLLITPMPPISTLLPYPFLGGRHGPAARCHAKAADTIHQGQALYYTRS